MAEEPPTIVLEYLRRIDRKVDVIDERVGRLELRMSSIDHHLAGAHMTDVCQTSEIERLKSRDDRIERRLELGE